MSDAGQPFVQGSAIWRTDFAVGFHRHTETLMRNGDLNAEASPMPIWWGS